MDLVFEAYFEIPLEDLVEARVAHVELAVVSGGYGVLKIL